MMLGTMFSRNPFAYFYNDFEDFDTWTNWGYNRKPPRQQRRVRSADPDEISRRNFTRRRQPTWATPFWEIPCQYDEEMPRNNSVEEDYHTRAPRKGGKYRHKARVIPTPRDNEIDSEENTTVSDGEIRQDDVQQQAEDNPSEKEKVYEEKERQSEETSPAMKASADTNEMEEEQLSEDKLEECETIKETSTGEKIHETEEKMETEQGKENVNEEEPSEGENSENKTENQEENIEEKLKLIDEQLKKAKELAPKEVLMAPRTQKQKLYLTEMLLRCILELDSIETRGNKNVKQRRREVVRKIQSYLDIVENDQETNVALES